MQAALAGMPGFEIEFRGLTASRGAVRAQGFPRDATRPRAQLRARFADTLKALRTVPLGTLRVDRVELVQND